MCYVSQPWPIIEMPLKIMWYQTKPKCEYLFNHKKEKKKIKNEKKNLKNGTKKYKFVISVK